MINSEYKYSDLTANIIGAAMEVHSFLGSGFQEVIYQRALSYEMGLRGITHSREVEMDVLYKNIHIGQRRVDFLVYNKICVEIKALTQLEPVHIAQGMNYLEVFNLEIGLLINFGDTKLRFHRLKNKKYENKSSKSH